MLGRTANDLFWMARYMERAENMARLLEVGHRLVLMPHDGGEGEWRSTLRSSGCESGYVSRHGALETAKVVDYLLLDKDNPSSVYSCLASARSNARAQRTAITRDMWESLNSAWIDFSSTASRCIEASELPALFDWIRERSALFRGAFLNTVLRNDTFYFTQLGTFIERADNTARILDVKYYVLLPQNEFVGGGVDSAQWAAILRSVSAHRSYRWVYRDTFKPWHIADFLILNPLMPRSLRSCYNEILAALAGLGAYYAVMPACHGRAEAILADLGAADMAPIFQSGLHEFLVEFIAGNNALASDIAETYNFNP
ncbi:MAG: alpha-E domain-containing protein [Hyphomicrobiaceae bacterium]|nr:alpha-E domain-containing protein [Hyphomicrobiaceae bacterium]